MAPKRSRAKANPRGVLVNRRLSQRSGRRIRHSLKELLSEVGCHVEVAATTTTRPSARLLRPVKIGTVCSGMGVSDQYACEQVFGKHGFVHTFSCERNPHAVQVMQSNFPAEMHLNEAHEFHESAPFVYILTSGFPCEPFSTNGLRQGLSCASGSGLVILAIVLYIRKMKPRIVILENADALCKHHSDFWWGFGSIS